jgi:tetratricopeptide (TPR) repeat protein
VADETQHSRRWRLPAPYRHLAGRANELATLERLLEDEGLLVLRGLPGVGKSQLAAHLAERASETSSLVAWLRAAQPGLADDARALAVEAGSLAPDQPGGEEPLHALADWLAAADRWLLVLDGAAGPDELVALLDRRPCGGRIVVTTTDGGWLEPGEVHDVQPLAVGDAEGFLLERTGESGAAAQEVAEALASRLDGLPLAMRQCEGWVRSGRSTLARYLELFDKRAQDLMRAGPSPLDHRHTVAVTFDLALAAAQERHDGARDLLRALAFLSSDPFPRAWLTDDAGDNLRLEQALHALSAVSLVELAPDHITVHGLVGEVMRGTVAGELRRRSLLRAREWMLTELPDEALESSNWAVYGQVVGHLEAVADHLLEHALCDSQTVLLLDRLATFHQAQGRFGRARARFEQAVDFSGALGANDVQRRRAQGDLALLVAKIDLAEGIPMLEEIADHWRARPDENPMALADALNNLGWAVGPRDPDRSAALLQEAIGLYARVVPERNWANTQQVVHALMNYGLALWRNGDSNGAEREWLRVLELMRRATVDRRAEMATVLSNLGVVYDGRGEGAEAVSYSQQGYDVTVELYGENHPETVQRLINLGGARRVLGETEGPEHLHVALEAHRRAERQARELEPPALDLVALAANNQGLDLLGLDQPQKALEPLTCALELRRQLADGELDLDAMQSLGNVAKALLKAGRPQEAERRYREVLAACDEMNLPSGHDRRALSWDGLGEVADRAGNHAQAAEFFDRSYRAFADGAGLDASRTRSAAAKRAAARLRAQGTDEKDSSSRPR